MDIDEKLERFCCCLVNTQLELGLCCPFWGYVMLEEGSKN